MQRVVKGNETVIQNIDRPTERGKALSEASHAKRKSSFLLIAMLLLVIVEKWSLVMHLINIPAKGTGACVQNSRGSPHYENLMVYEIYIAALIIRL